MPKKRTCPGDRRAGEELERRPARRNHEWPAMARSRMYVGKHESAASKMRGRSSRSRQESQVVSWCCSECANGDLSV